jgi:hypothetical protein
MTYLDQYAIDSRTPADAAMELEEYQEQADTVDLAGIREIPRDALKIILRFIISPQPDGRISWGTATKRLIALASEAGVEAVADRPMSYHAERLGFTRGALSHHAVRIADELGQAQTRGGKSKAAREAYSAAAIISHRQRGNRVRIDEDASDLA